MKKYLSKSYLARYLVLILALLVMGLTVSLMQMACLGADPITSLNLALSIKFNLSVGTCLTICNFSLLIFNLIFNRKYMGPCTIIFMLLIGPSADMWHSIIVKLLGTFPLFTSSSDILLRAILLIIVILASTFAVSFIIVSELGTPPYDALAYFIERVSKNKLSFKYARILMDSCAVLTAILILINTSHLFEVIGIGTIILSLLVGPVLNFFIERCALPFMTKLKNLK